MDYDCFCWVLCGPLALTPYRRGRGLNGLDDCLWQSLFLYYGRVGGTLEICENLGGSAHSFGVLNPGLVNPGLNGFMRGFSSYNCLLFFSFCGFWKS
jgi:hypothetical protein